ncbi:hypothetical protein Dsin_030056 [Dipteronia sinensis]|uniref:Uncharacterized protein n=1 Tax=Dipteronia sinensis TaxID=43782 RepID=A0AAD9ZIP6_9ROSI|nr:hypothetical protein Dsin_030056 [Dipteronia sinensis]
MTALVLDGTQSHGDSRLVKKYGKITLSLIQRRDTFAKHYVDYDDLRVVIGNVTASRRNSIGLGDDIDARTFGVEYRHVGIEDYEYDADNRAFVQSQHEPLHQSESLEQSTSPLSHQTMSSENTNQADIIEKLSHGVDSIAADFRGFCSLMMEKRESYREKREIEKK